MKDNISKLKNCYGCGVCVAACPVNIIDLKENVEGFFSPVVSSQDKCVECGLCLRVCAFNDDKVCAEDAEIKGYAAWSKDKATRLDCSSGGVAFEVGKQLINSGHKAIGVRYDAKKHRAEHFIAIDKDTFKESVGSKYIQSYTTDALVNLNRQDRYFVCGTPCMIDSLRRYIKVKRMEDNFVLVDFFCHGVPSLLMWDKYIKGVQSELGSEISTVRWRDKATGWHDSWAFIIKSKEGKTYTSRFSEGDLFYRFFLGNYCLNKCCYKSCKYKMTSSAADIRVGDLWGKSYQNNTEGVSSVLALTRRGQSLLSNLDDIELRKYDDLSTVMEGQMTHGARMPAIRDKVVEQLGGQKTLNQIYSGLIWRYNLRFLPARIIRKLKRMAKL